MGFVPVQFHAFHQVQDFAIGPNFYKALFGNLLKKFPVMSFSRSYHRCQDVYAFALKTINNQFFNLLIGIAHHFFASMVTIGITGTRKKQS